MSQHSLLVVGSANVDLVVSAEHLPKPGETLLGGVFRTFSGGKGANQAVAAARAGGRVTMAGCVGRDDFGKRLMRELGSAGIDVSGMSETDSQTGVALIVTAASGENAIVVAPGANSDLDPAAIDARFAACTGVTHVLAQLETPLDTVVRVAEKTRERNATFLLDPAPARQLPPELLNKADWITPNEREAHTLLGVEADEVAPFDIARAIQALGPRNVILKMSSKGAIVLEGDAEPVHIPPFAVTAIDTTAAGDAFNGAFAVALSEGSSAIDSARFASAAAAISVTRRGAQPSMATRAEIDAMLRQRVVA